MTEHGPFIATWPEATAWATRREFLANCFALSLLVAPARGQDSAGRASEGDAVLLALIGTLLPFEDPRFPQVSPQRLLERLRTLLPQENDEQRVAFQQALLLFDRPDAFPDPAFMPREAGIADDYWPQIVADEQSSLLRFRESLREPADRFRDFQLVDQRAYLTLWARSGLGPRRRFYRSTKSLVMVTAYSMDEFWQAIGYGGPLLEGGR
ncbi:MAG: hypothetical protein O3C40_35135 [Planctomycetota bacterium]|nr:hypothetical protein [Planctomycetota bacterium]